MEFNDKFSLILKNLSTEDYEKRTFILKRYLKNGHLQ